MIITSIVICLRCINQNCQNTQTDFPSAKDNQVFPADHYFYRRKRQLLEIRGNWQL